MATHPQWATKFRRKGTELRCIKGKYYLYEVSSKWNPEKKRSQKISGKLLGRITKEDGFIESDKDKLRKRELTVSNLCVKEFGISVFIQDHLSDYVELLQQYFPSHWQAIIVLTYARLVHQSAFKNVEFHFLNSFLSESYHGLGISAKHITTILRELGTERDRIVQFLHEFNHAEDNVLFDGTDIFCNSKKMGLGKFSKTKRGTFDCAASIMFAFSTGLQMPVYYRVMPGNIKDIKAFRLCLEESGIKNAVIIADKGFFSEANAEMLKQEELKFIIPLKRNNSHVDYSRIASGDKKNLEGFFMFENRIIWYYTINKGSEMINVYIDDELKTEESKDYLVRTQTLPEKFKIEKFHERQYKLGTIAVLHNLDKSPEQVFADYKSRGQVETMIDTLKNELDADRSYMQNEQAVEAWMLINFIALHWYYRILQLLKAKKLNGKFSPKDLLRFLGEIRKVKINDKWHLAEVTKKYSLLLNDLGLHIT